MKHNRAELTRVENARISGELRDEDDRRSAFRRELDEKYARLERIQEKLAEDIRNHDDYLERQLEKMNADFQSKEQRLREEITEEGLRKEDELRAAYAQKEEDLGKS
jgi:hypothetical protein